MHILVTGGTGLIGRHLIPRLQLLGHQVSVVTRDVAAARACRSGPDWRSSRTSIAWMR
nr:Glutathione S-transferase YfcF [Candidatus Pantoea persica]